MAEQPIPIILSVPTSANGATAAATYAFFSSDYRPPRQERASENDTVQNPNGTFRYNYDNGPGPYVWQPFMVVLTDDFEIGYLPRATQQWANLQHLWKYTEGPMGMQTPDGIYTVIWAAGAPLERAFLTSKGAAGDKQAVEFRVPLNFEEG